jgi:hypothetical protein
MSFMQLANNRENGQTMFRYQFVTLVDHMYQTAFDIAAIELRLSNCRGVSCHCQRLQAWVIVVIQSLLLVVIVWPLPSK